MKWNRTNKYLSDARGRIPILRGLTVLTILLIMAIMLGGNGPPVFSETISDLFNADVLPSDSDVTPAEAVILEKTTLKEKHNPVIRRSRHVRANLDVLLQQGPMGLPLFNDVYLIVDKDRIDKRERGSYTVHGLVQGVDDSDVMIVVEQGMMVGHIRVDGTLYYVESIGSNLYTIQEWDESVFHSDMSPLIPDSEEMKEGEGLRIAFVDQEESPTNGTDTGELIDVMIVCTEDAVLGAGGLAKMNAIIQKAVEDTNQAYANSGIKPRIRLVHTAQIPYTETGNMKTDLERMTYHKDHKMDPIGIMDVVHTWRDSFGADLVSLIVEKGNGGLAWLTKPSATYASMGFSVLQREGLGMSQHKLARAFGHNMGAANNPKDANGRGAYAYSHGHRYQHPHDAKKNFRTIMAQPCKTGDVCNVKPYFSNPKKSLKGIPTGIVDQRDNVRTLNATAKVVANFRRSVDSKIRLSVEEPDSVSALSTFKGNYKRGDDKGFYVSTLTSQGTPTNTEELNVMNGPIDCDKKHGKDWVKKIVLQNATEAFKDKRDPWVIIDCHLTLEKTNVVTKRLIFKGGGASPRRSLGGPRAFFIGSDCELQWGNSEWWQNVGARESLGMAGGRWSRKFWSMASSRKTKRGH